MMNLYLFDFDGTLTKRDTLFEFTRFVVGDFQYYLGLVLLAPLLILAKIGLISRDSTKVYFLKYFFKGKDKTFIENCANRFFKIKLPQLLRPKGLQEIIRLKEGNHEIAIVSASLDIWIKPFTDYYSLKLICTIADYDENNKLTGKIIGKNCNNKEKSNRILQMFDLKKYAKIIAYGDTKYDKHMFDLSHCYYYRHFHS